MQITSIPFRLQGPGAGMPRCGGVGLGAPRRRPGVARAATGPGAGGRRPGARPAGVAGAVR